MKLKIVGHHPGGVKPLAVLLLNGSGRWLSTDDLGIRGEPSAYFRSAGGLWRTR